MLLNVGASDGSCLMLSQQDELTGQVWGQGQLLTSRSAVVHRTTSMASMLPWWDHLLF